MIWIVKVINGISHTKVLENIEVDRDFRYGLWLFGLHLHDIFDKNEHTYTHTHANANTIAFSMPPSTQKWEVASVN